jgi:hypothetical protein
MREMEQVSTEKESMARMGDEEMRRWVLKQRQ